jgi:large repetitive protein
MNSNRIVRSVSFLFFMLLMLGLALPVSAKNVSHAPQQLIVKFKSNVKEQSKNEFLNLHQAKRLEHFSKINADLIMVPNTRTLDKWISILRGSSKIQYVEKNYEVSINSATQPNDPYYPSQWALNNPGGNGAVADADIDAPEAWALYSPTSQVIVAVIDTGVEYTHPDLNGSIWINSAEDLNKDGKCTKTDKNGKDEDANGYFDDCAGWDWANRDNDPLDDNGHGTHVSGVIAARSDNGFGIAGIVGQGSAKIMPLKFLRRNGSGYTSDAIKAIEYSIQKGAKISNNSWGGGGYSQALSDAINLYQQAGGLFVVAAGNDGRNNDSIASYPASYNLDNIVVVASTTNADKLSSFSNYGATAVDLAAPGSNIISTVTRGSFATYSGTSMATPHVSGVAALILSQNPALSWIDVKAKLLSSVRKVNSLTGYTATGGVVNAQNALTP